MLEGVSLSRRRLLRLGAGLTLAGAAALLPASALQADAPPAPLPDSIRQALQSLAGLGFQNIVAVYNDLRPSIEIQPQDFLTYAGMTLGWATSPGRNASIQLRADLERAPLFLMATLAHELLHVWQFTYDADIYADCLAREVAAYRLEASVLRTWCTANPSLSLGLPLFYINLISIAEEGYPETLESFAAKASCGMR
jgi:hypothetical protein